MKLQDVPTERLQQTAETARLNNYEKVGVLRQYFTPGSYAMQDVPYDKFREPLLTNLEEIEQELNRRLNA